MTEVSASLVPDVFDINNKFNMSFLLSVKSQEDQVTSLRRFIRKITKEFDTFINFVESLNNPKNQLQREDQDIKECKKNKTDFESLKMKVITNISYLSNEVASTTLLSTNSFSPEMYNESRIKVTNKIINKFNVFIQAIQAVLSRAVGDSASSFKKTPNATRNELQI